MPIKNLSEGRITRPLLPPTLGALRKGEAKKNDQMGKDLNDHFRFTPENSRDVELTKAFYDIFGSKPTNIPFVFPSDKLDDCFFRFNEEYTRAGVQHFCDGENIYERNRMSATWEKTDKLCPYFKDNPKRIPRPKDKNGKELGCQPNARLSVYVPDLIRATGRVGVIKILTKSPNDIAHIEDQFHLALQNFGTIKETVGFVLYRSPSLVTAHYVDKSGAQRQSVSEKWFIKIATNPEFMLYQLESRKQLYLSGGMKSLPAPQEEIIEAEFSEDLTTDEAVNLMYSQLEEIAELAQEYGFTSGIDLAYASNLKSVRDIDEYLQEIFETFDNTIRADAVKAGVELEVGLSLKELFRQSVKVYEILDAQPLDPLIGLADDERSK